MYPSTQLAGEKAVPSGVLGLYNRLVLGILKSCDQDPPAVSSINVKVAVLVPEVDSEKM